MVQHICQSCAIPFKDTKPGTNADGTDSQDYCYHCYAYSKLKWPALTMDGMIKLCLKHTVPHIYLDEETARKAMQDFFPKLKRWTV